MENLNEIVKKLVKYYPEIYDPTLLKFSDLSNKIGKIINKKIFNKKELIIIQIKWSNFIFNNYK